MIKILLFLMLALILVGCQKMVCFDKEVKQVGGCDRHGECGTTFVDGSHGTAMYPSPGAFVNTCRWVTVE